MHTVEFNNNFVKAYLELLENASPENKLDLIARLSESVKHSLEEKPDVDQFYGAWQSEASAEEMIEQMRASRTFTRQTEGF